MAAPLLLVSDFNADLLARYLTASPIGGDFAVQTTPYNQVYQSITSASADATRWSVIWARAESVIPAFASALAMEAPDETRCLAEVDDFADLLVSFARGGRHCFVVSWSLPPTQRGYGMLEWRRGIGLTQLLARMNLRLAERLENAGNVYLLNGDSWFRGCAKPAAAKMWYAAKVPYANEVFEHAASDIGAAARALTGRSRRLVVLDLDNTLWGGVIGEVGWAGIRLGGHDYLGEAFKDFQTHLKSLSHWGIQLAVVSKNDEAVALEAFDKHPEMALRRDDLAGWRINWNDKAANIAALAEDLNLGLASIVLIDDNAAERDRVRTALPDVFVPEWPVDPTAYVTALHQLTCFESAAVSSEDRARTGMYRTERERRHHRLAVDSPDRWLESLGTTIRVEPVHAGNIARVTQLFNKTNQVNLTTRRLTDHEIMDWVSASSRSMLALSVADRFGDLGLVGIIGVEFAEGSREGHLTDFILSCRVMGRKVENAMIGLALADLGRLGARIMVARYLPTERNRPTLDVLRGAGLTEVEEYVFEYSCDDDYPIPIALAVNRIENS